MSSAYPSQTVSGTCFETGQPAVGLSLPLVPGIGGSGRKGGGVKEGRGGRRGGRGERALYPH